MHAFQVFAVVRDEALQGYEDFDAGAARKYVLNPNDLIPA